MGGSSFRENNQNMSSSFKLLYHKLGLHWSKHTEHLIILSQRNVQNLPIQPFISNVVFSKEIYYWTPNLKVWKTDFFTYVCGLRYLA